MEELVNQMRQLCEYLCAEAQKSLTGNKAAGVRARKTSLQLEKVLKTFRTESIRFTKQ